MTAFELYLEWRDGEELKERGDAEDVEGKGRKGEGIVVGKRMKTRRAWQVPDPVEDNVDYKLAKRPFFLDIRSTSSLAVSFHSYTPSVYKGTMYGCLCRVG